MISLNRWRLLIFSKMKYWLTCPMSIVSDSDGEMDFGPWSSKKRKQNLEWRIGHHNTSFFIWWSGSARGPSRSRPSEVKLTWRGWNKEEYNNISCGASSEMGCIEIDLPLVQRHNSESKCSWRTTFQKVLSSHLSMRKNKTRNRCAKSTRIKPETWPEGSYGKWKSKFLIWEYTTNHIFVIDIRYNDTKKAQTNQHILRFKLHRREFLSEFRKCARSFFSFFSLYIAKSIVSCPPMKKLIHDSICNLFCLYHCVVSSPSTIMNVLPEANMLFLSLVPLWTKRLAEEIGLFSLGAQW